MSYTRRNTEDGVTVMSKDLYDNLQDGIEERELAHTFINVLSLKFKNDGSEDCSLKLQELIDETEENESLKLFFPAGTYKFSSQIIINKSIEFIGESYLSPTYTVEGKINLKGGTVFDFSSCFEEGDCIDSSDYHRKTICNITIYSSSFKIYENRDNTPNGNRPTSPVYTFFNKVNQSGISINGYGSILDNVYVIGFSNYGIHTIQHNFVRNCWVISCGNSFFVSKADNSLYCNRATLCKKALVLKSSLNTVVDFRCDSVSEIALHLMSYSNSNLIYGFSCDYVMYAGIQIESNCVRNKISGTCGRSGVFYAGWNVDSIPSEELVKGAGIVFNGQSGNNYIDVSCPYNSAIDSNPEISLVPSIPIIINGSISNPTVNLTYHRFNNTAGTPLTITDYLKVIRAISGGGSITIFINGLKYETRSFQPSQSVVQITTIVNNQYFYSDSAISRKPAVTGLFCKDSEGNVYMSIGTNSIDDWKKLT